jgi:hypothetical protein
MELMLSAQLRVPIVMSRGAPRAEGLCSYYAQPTVSGSYVAGADEYSALITAEKGRPDSVAGVLARANVDPDRWRVADIKCACTRS